MNLSSDFKNSESSYKNFSIKVLNQGKKNEFD